VNANQRAEVRRYDHRRERLLRVLLVPRFEPLSLDCRGVEEIVAGDGEDEGEVIRWKRYAIEVCSHDSLTPYWLNGFDFWAKYAVRSMGGTSEKEVFRAKEYSSAYAVPVLPTSARASYLVRREGQLDLQYDPHDDHSSQQPRPLLND
jgi:hypothetical protein